MKTHFTALLGMVCLAILTACSGNGQKDYLSYVDPFIGTGEHGHVFLGASVPFGTIQAGPQNIHKGWDWCSGYHYSDSIIIGFSHTHLSGTGCADLGDILLMPYVGEIRTRRGEQNDISNSCSSYYKHEKEQCSPDYYALKMENGVKAELTASGHVAMHRYTFPDKEAPRVLLNLQEGNGDRASDTYMRLADKYTVEGYRVSNGWSPKHQVHFTIRSKTPISELLVFDEDKPAGSDSIRGKAAKGVLLFEGDPREVELKVAISSVSAANAALNMESEVPHWNFDKVRRQARELWNSELSKVEVSTPDENKKKIFYTALYHAFIAPTVYADVNGEFRGHDDKIYKADWVNYSTFSLWDTYRTLNPLFTIIQPERVSDMVNSMLSIYDQQGRLPIWPLVGGETNQMPGYSSIPVITDAYLKGFGGFDAERAFAACKSSAENPAHDGIAYVLSQEYIPCDKVGEATSKAMEYAVGDWGIAAMAKKMGKTDEAELFAKRGRYYTHYVDTTIGFVRPKNADGSWLADYDPFNSVHGGQGYFCEGTGWQYTFFVPQHPEGLIELLGGDARFVQKLDSLFSVEGDMGEFASPDISGLIGQYAHGNEPSHHIIYMYAYAGQQWKTAQKVRYVQNHFYTSKPEGIIGNEDCGQMSAWHILSAFGFYQVNPSNGIFVFGSPQFDSAVIQLPEGKQFTVLAQNNTPENMYIQSVTLNGQPYEKSYIRYDDIMKGGTLEFVMGAQPNKSFGVAPENRPVSL